MRRLDPGDYVANKDLPMDDARVKVEMGTLDRTPCPHCEAPLPDLTDLLDDCGHASGQAFIACPACEAPLFLETETLVYAFTARRRAEPLPYGTICTHCNDTHRITRTRDGHEDQVVMCTWCPTPCQECRAGRTGAFCETTPCPCACHSSSFQYKEAHRRALATPPIGAEQKP